VSVNNGSESPIIEVTTLFLVVVDTDGQSRVVLDQDSRFSAQRAATPKDVFPALANICADYQAIKSAPVLSFQTVMARQLAEQAQAEQTPQEQAAD
jgi:hypothetical protein